MTHLKPATLLLKRWPDFKTIQHSDIESRRIKSLVMRYQFDIFQELKDFKQ